MSPLANEASPQGLGISQEAARDIMDDIRVLNGGLPEEDWVRMSEKGKKSYINLQVLAGNGIIHVAKDLYDADARFIYELIQNADDNKYNAADHQGQPKFLHFTLYHDRMTVESNEDGFSEQDLRAICSIHQSTKRQTGGYVGHKGIGFKSVFKVAYKVRVQSGPFCFSLEHREGDSGLGMVTPSNTPHEKLPENVKTRMTLFLASGNDFSIRAQELKEIPKTILLFLRRLQNIQVDIYPLQGSSLHLVFKRTTSRQLVTLTKESNGSLERDLFLTETDILNDLPAHPSRPQQPTAEATLAFPVDSSLKPILEPQYVYSFLPMRREGFNFLIHSDFITQASRQGIHNCERNQVIREKISLMFVAAIKKFIKKETLQFDWIEYLPQGPIHDPFWSLFCDKIFSKLRESEVFFTRKGTLVCPLGLQYLSTRHCDNNGQPLFDDMQREIYLSPSYKCSANQEALGQLGITKFSFENIFRLLSPYLKGASPRFLGPDLDDDWHKKVAELLIRAIEAKPETYQERIRQMNLVPSSDGTLLAASSSVYFPDDFWGHCIPDDLGIPLVARDALKDESRQKLFGLLGVIECHPKYVIPRIFNRYNRPGVVTLQDSVAHLKYFFLSSPVWPLKDDCLDNRIYLMDQQEVPVYRAFVPYGAEILVDDLYFETSGEYGTAQLALDLRPTDDENGNESGGEGEDEDNEGNGEFTIHIIHEAYIHAVPHEALVCGMSWVEWLEKAASVRHVPRLVNSRTGGLSDLFQRIAKFDVIKLLGLYKSNQDLYNREITFSAVKEIRDLEVPCTNGMFLSLKKTRYPLEELKQICERIGVNDSIKCFLAIGDDWPTNDITGWYFLRKFGVEWMPNWSFFLEIAIVLARTDPEDAVSGAVAMYEEISKRFHENEDELKDIFFCASVLVPCIGGIRAEWREVEDCVWTGHPSLRTKRPLSVHEEFSSRPHVAHLFKNMLCLVDAGLTTYLGEIEFYKAECQLAGPEDADPVDTDSEYLESEERKIYVNLSDLLEMYREVAQRSEGSHIRAVFNDNELVYLPSQELWVSPSLCVWAAAPKMGKKYGISETYGSLTSFFQDILHVRTPSTETYIEELKVLVPSGYEKIKDIEETLHIMNGMHFSDAQVEELHRMAFLPVRDAGGEHRLARPADDFLILNRSEFEAAFREQVPTLSFSLEQIVRLQCLLSTLRLEDRYASRLVRIVTEARDPASEISTRATRRFRKRAKHLYRCGSNYEAAGLRADPSNVFRLLQTANIYESEGFQRTLVLHYGDIEVNAQSGNGLVHIEVQNNVLRVFIPRDHLDQKRCYRTELPKVLSSHLGIRDEKALQIFRTIFTTSEEILESVLNDDGVIPFSHPDSREADSQSSDGADSDAISISSHTSSEEDSDEELTSSQASDSSPVNHDSPNLTPASIGSDISSQAARSSQRAFDSRPAIPSHTVSPSPSRVDPALGITFGQTQYVEALTNVIDQARAANFRGNLRTPANIHRNSWDNVGFGFSIESPNRLDRDIKVGAAGEVYVFERLLQLGLPGFSRSNWKSTIRKNVNVHPDYHDLSPWNGSETADIIYHDSDSVLTSILIDEGHLPRLPRNNSTPTYYIEVKTTTAECETPFFMSNSQYVRMQSYASNPGAGSAEDDRVYIIFRVSKVTSGNIGMKVYFDPEKLRQERRLIFTADTWSVRPPAI